MSVNDLDVTVTEISNLDLLDEDWDSYGAPKIDAESIAAAILFMRTVWETLPKPIVGPTVSGCVNLLFDLKGVTVGLEISQP